MNKKKIFFWANIISSLFDGVKITPFLIFLAVNFSKPKIGIIPIFLLSLVIIYFLPLTFFIYLLKNKKITDKDISQRKQRPLYFSFVFLCFLIFLATLFILKEKQVIMFFLKLLIPFFLFFLITFFWKISGHTFLNSFFIQLLYLNTNKTIILYMGIFWLAIIGWARIVLKKHSLGQVIVGALLPFIILFFYP